MSISLRTASMVISPHVNESSNGKTYFSTDVMEPVNYTVEFSADGGNNPKQLELLFKDAYENGEAVDISYIQKKGRFGTSFVVFDIKPIKPLNTAPKP